MVDIATLTPGAIFAGRYRVERLLKAGGMGAVYVVRHVRTNAAHALKVMHPAVVANPTMRERFVQEAQVASLIDSPYVVQVTDADVDDATGMPFLVMELLRGCELGEMLAQKGRFDADVVITWLTQVARALDKAHAANIVHRDLKPANLFLVVSDHEPIRVKILDFGIAKIVRAVGPAVTTQAFGTPLFMAPEQTGKSRQIGPWTDIWALGLLAYLLLVGRHYWEAETVEELFGEILANDHEPASVRASRAGVMLPRTFDEWFSQCVSREPERRFGRATAAVTALAGALRIAPTVSAAPPPAVPVTQATLVAAPPTMTQATLVATPPTIVPDVRSALASTTAPASTQALPPVVPPPAPVRRARSARGLLAVMLGAGVIMTCTLAVLVVRSKRKNAPPPPPQQAAPPSLTKTVEKQNPFVDVKRLRMQRHEVTRGEFAAYLLSLEESKRAGARPLRDWPGEPLRDGTDRRPVAWVPYSRAERFCAAIGAHLPDSSEWRSALARQYPWGNVWPPPKLVTFSRRPSDPLPNVESAEGDVTPDGVFDLFGSVREWTTSVKDGRALLLGAKLDTDFNAAEYELQFPPRKRIDVGVDPADDPETFAEPFLGFRCVRTR